MHGRSGPRRQPGRRKTDAREKSAGADNARRSLHAAQHRTRDEIPVLGAVCGRPREGQQKRRRSHIAPQQPGHDGQHAEIPGEVHRLDVQRSDQAAGLRRWPTEQVDLCELHEVLAEVTELHEQQRLEDAPNEPASCQPASHVSAARCRRRRAARDGPSAARCLPSPV